MYVLTGAGADAHKDDSRAGREAFLPPSRLSRGRGGLGLGVLLAVAASAVVSAASAVEPVLSAFEIAEPEAVGLSSSALAQVTEALQAHVDAGDIAGVVAAVVKDGKLVYHQALGHRDIAQADPMPLDALFRVYSMTRPITSLGVLMLHERGLLNIDDPVQKYLPEFADQPVMRDAAGTDAAAVRPRVGDITLAQLLTHTSGIGDRNSPAYRQHNVHSYDQTLSEVVANVAAMPLYEDPGTRYRYGMHAEILGRVIEVVSGQDIESFYQQWIFGPLNMTDTVFYVDADRQHRLAPVYRPDANGRLQLHQMEHIPVTERRALTSSGVGLVSSTMDFLKFSQLFLNNGQVDGTALIAPDTVRMMADNAVPDALLPLGGASGYWGGSGWSLGGMAVVMDPEPYGHTVVPGEYWWDGSAGTRFWIDPINNMITIVMAQVSPAHGNGFRENFKTLVYEALPD